MRGKSNGDHPMANSSDQASMRPAHYAREVPMAFHISVPRGIASMRPAHYAREV